MAGLSDEVKDERDQNSGLDSDEDDDLTIAVLQLQSRLFQSSEAPNDEETVSHKMSRATSQISSGRNDAGEEAVVTKIHVVQDTKHGHPKLPSVAQVFSDIQNPVFRESDDFHAASSRNTRQAPPSEPATKTAKEIGLPEAGSWHVPLTFVDVVQAKKKATEEQVRHTTKEEMKRRRESAMIKSRTNNSESVKVKEKAKRQKGQSSHSTWKSEEFMRLKQTYD